MPRKNSSQYIATMDVEQTRTLQRLAEETGVMKKTVLNYCIKAIESMDIEKVKQELRKMSVKEKVSRIEQMIEKKKQEKNRLLDDLSS